MVKLFSKQKVMFPQRMYEHKDVILSDLPLVRLKVRGAMLGLFSEITEPHSLKGLIRI